MLYFAVPKSQSEEYVDQDVSSVQARRGKVGGHSSRYFAEAQRPEGITDTIPGVRWRPSNTPRYYCTREAHHGNGRINEVYFYLNIGEVRRVAAATPGVNAKSLPLAVLAHAMGGCDIAWLEATEALRCLAGGSEAREFFPLDSQFVRLSIPAGIAAERQLVAPASGWYDYPTAAVLTETAASGHSRARGGTTTPPAATQVVVPTPSPQQIILPDPGVFARWVSGESAPPSALPSYVADAYYRIYVPLHREGPILDDDINRLIDVLARNSEHTVLVQDAYNAGVGEERTTENLVADLVDYATKIRQDPEQGNIRNFVIYLLIRAGATVSLYDIPIHTTEESPFRIEAIYAPTRDGVTQLPVSARSWFRLHAHKTTATASLFNLRQDQHYTISWFVEYLDADNDRVTILPARINHANRFDHYQSQDAGNNTNPFFANHVVLPEHTGNYKIIASIAWWEQLHPPGKIGPSRPHVHFVEHSCQAVPVDDRLRTALAKATPSTYGNTAAGYYAQAAYAQAMPADIAYDLQQQVIAPAQGQSDTESQTARALHFVRIDAPGIRQVYDGRSFTAHFSLSPIHSDDDNSDPVSARWYVASSNYADVDHAKVGSSIDPRLVADSAFLLGGDGDSYSFATQAPGDYAIVAVPSDGSFPIMYPLRVFGAHDREAQMAAVYYEKAERLRGYADAGFRSNQHTDPQPYTINPITDTRFVPLRAVHLSKKTGETVTKNLYLATTDPHVDWARLASGDIAGHNGFHLIDAGLGTLQSVYHGGTIPHCITRFSRENTYPHGWVYLSLDPTSVDPRSTAAPIHFGPFETTAQSDMEETAGKFGSYSLGLSLGGMAMTGLCPPLGILCLVVGQSLALASTIADLQANRTQDQINKKLIWIDVVGLAAGLAGLAGLGQLVLGARGVIAAAGSAEVTAIRLGQTQITLGLVDTALSGAEVLLMGSHTYEEIDRILGNQDLDNDQKIMMIAGAFANVILGGGLVALGAHNDIFGHKTRKAESVQHKRRPDRPSEEGGRPRAPGEPMTLTRDVDIEIGRSLDATFVEKLRALNETNPSRVDLILRRLYARVDRLGGWREIRANPEKRNAVSRWLTLQLAEIDEAEIITRLINALPKDISVDAVALLRHYRAMGDGPDADGLARRFLADIDGELQNNGITACTARIQARVIVEFGATPLLIHRFLDPVFQELRAYKFITASQIFERRMAHFNDRGYQTALSPTVRKRFARVYVHQQERSLYRLEDQLLRNARDADGRRTLSDGTVERLRALRTHYQRQDGSFDMGYVDLLQMSGITLTAKGPEAVALIINGKHVLTFGYNDQAASAILNLELDYLVETRNALYELGWRGPELRRLDNAQTAKTATPLYGDAPVRPDMAPGLSGPKPTIKDVFETLRNDITWLIHSPTHRTQISRALVSFLRQHAKDLPLLINIARSNDSAKRVFFALLRVCSPFNDSRIVARALESLTRRNYHDVLSTRAHQDGYDTQHHRFAAAFPNSPLAYGEAAHQLPALRDWNYGQCKRQLQSRGFQPVAQWPTTGDNVTRMVWFHPTDGSVVRLETSYTERGTQRTTVHKSVMQLDPDGRPYTPRLDDDDNELYRIADAPGTGEDYTVFDSTQPSSQRSADTHSRLPANREDAATQTRDRLAGLLPDGGASLTPHDIDELTALWESVTEVPLRHLPRQAETEPTIRSQTEAPSSVDEPGKSSSASKAPTSSEADGGLRGGRSPSSSRDELDESIDQLVELRRQAGLETSDADIEAIRILVARKSMLTAYGMQSGLFVHCTGLRALVELDQIYPSPLGNPVIQIIHGRTTTAGLKGLNHDLEGLLKLVRAVGPADAIVHTSGITRIDDWDLLGRLFVDDQDKARAILLLSRKLPSGHPCRVELYSAVYDTVGPKHFAAHTAAEDATLVVTVAQTQALERSTRHFDGTPMAGYDTRQRVQPEHPGASGRPIADSRDIDMQLAFVASGDELGQHGFRVVLLDDIWTSTPKPKSNELDEVAAYNQTIALKQHARDKYLGRQGLRDSGKPVYEVNGRITDVYDVADVDALGNLSQDLSMAAAKGYARNAVVYLKHGSIIPAQVHRHLQETPPLLLENCLVVDANGVHRVWPSTGDSPERLPRRD